MLLEEYSDPTALKALHEKVIAWYDNFWPRVRRYISDHIIASFGDSAPMWLSRAASKQDSFGVDPASLSTAYIELAGDQTPIDKLGQPDPMACDSKRQLILERQVEDLQRRVESLETIVAQLQR